MPFQFEARPSDSPLAQSVWRTQSGDVSQFMSLACTHLSMVVMKQDSKLTFTVRGPETTATIVDCPENAEFFGLEFKHGAFVRGIPSHALVDGSFDMSDSGGQSFWLNGRYWQFPTYENVDTFLDRLVGEDVLQWDGVVDAVMRDQTLALSSRTVQRRFRHATGLSHRTLVQIERAREAARLLTQGLPILDTVHRLGYADQPHLTRALKRFMGQTPVQLIKEPIDSSGL